jgi:hypothetical protein
VGGGGEGGGKSNGCQGENVGLEEREVRICLFRDGETCLMSVFIEMEGFQSDGLICACNDGGICLLKKT